MTSRNLTPNFFEFRNRATRDRSFRADDKPIDDRTALLQNQDEDVVEFEKPVSPLWVEAQRRLQLQFDGVRSRLKKLEQLHNRHFARPDFDENSSEEKEIESITKDITSMLTDCHTSVQRLSLQAAKSQKAQNDQRSLLNVVQATANALQDLTTKFRKCQSTYLHKLQSRKENLNSNMSGLEINMHSSPFDDRNDVNQNFDQLSLTSDDQLQVTSQNVEFSEKRDQEIRQALQSMEEINALLRDFATIISSQGTMLDQIEYNIENTVVQLEQGNEQIVKAVKLQERSLKFKLIVIGIGAFVLLFVIFVSIISR